MSKHVIALSASFFSVLALSHGRLPAAPPVRDEPLNLEQARAYMLELINRDRAAKDLVPVALDEAATTAAQRHAEEMAAEQYMSHYNLAGKSPNQRYTEAGGTGYSRENVYLSTTRYVGAKDDESDSRLPLVAAPAFSRREIEEIESSYVNETPPNDGHRKNVFAPEHTHVGIGLARAAGREGRTLANAQEFVDRYADADPIPASVAVGAEVRVTGKTVGGARLRSLSVAHAPLPAPLTRAQASAIHSYSVPAADATFWPPPYRSARPVRLSPDGAFESTIPLGLRSGPGLYYIGIWVEVNGRDLLASLRTVVVR